MILILLIISCNPWVDVFSAVKLCLADKSSLYDRLLSWMDKHHWIIIPSKTKDSAIRYMTVDIESRVNDMALNRLQRRL